MQIGHGKANNPACGFFKGSIIGRYPAWKSQEGQKVPLINQDLEQAFDLLRIAAEDRHTVTGLTHTFYRYPARFSPSFACAAIEAFTKEGQVVLDPFMGGGTTIVEALAKGRRAVGIDLNTLSHFITRVKTSPLRDREMEAITEWLETVSEGGQYRKSSDAVNKSLEDARIKHLATPGGKFLKKLLSVEIVATDSLPTDRSREFARCILIRTAQWALDGRRGYVSLDKFREQLLANAWQMLREIEDFGEMVSKDSNDNISRELVIGDAAEADQLTPFGCQGSYADLVLTSPPYPGVHVLYHRWQIQGRKESPAPYWISGSQDGQPESFYTMGSRFERENNGYFSRLKQSFGSIRRALKPSGHLVQLVAFNDIERQLSRYLDVMSEVGLEEITSGDISASRVWREVPNRKWHATYKGKINASKEVILVHKAM